MTRCSARRLLVTGLALALLATFAAPALADHTEPSELQAPTPPTGRPDVGQSFGEGEWEHITNFPANPGTDLFFWERANQVFAAGGTLGGASSGHVGQRILQLTEADGTVAPSWVADHGSASCLDPTGAGNTGLQHDVQAIPKDADTTELLVDATDSRGRCHDAAGGGLEFIDVTGVGTDSDDPVREIHLTRHDGTSHTVTVDDLRPWIVYSNAAEFSGQPWIEVMDIRSCLTEAVGGTLPTSATLETKRASCDPEVFRIPFQDEWAQQTTTLDGEPAGEPATCHDITARGTRLYCAGLAATLVFDVANLADVSGAIRGEALPCERVAAEPAPDAVTGAEVTDCVFETAESSPEEAYAALGTPQALGWEFLGRVNHVGTDTGNTNTQVRSDQEVAVSHQSDPTPRSVGEYLIVSDERGGGVVPGGASCGPGFENPFGNGGLHFYDISQTGPDAVFEHATMVDEDGNEAPAVWIGEGIVPTPTFCTVHVFHHLPDEQRIIVGYYTQGTKVLDYEIDEQGRFHFTEVASFILPESVQWVTNYFKINENPDGTRTYHMMANDIARGIDVFSWTHTPNPIAGPQVKRLSGENRIETAVAISQEAYDSADTVALARADVYADALAGAPLAAKEGAPILLTGSAVLAPEARAEIERLGATRVLLLGGTAAISSAIEQDLGDQGLEVVRVGASNRFGTAAAIAERLDPGGTAFLAEGIHAEDGRGWPDALAAAPYAAFRGEPVLLTARDILPPETRQALADRAVGETVVVGGTGAVSDEIVQQIDADGHGPRRLFGRTRYETSAAIYSEAVAQGMSTTTVWLATGRNWPDALAAGPVVGARGDTFLLVDGETLDNSPPTRDRLEANRSDIGLAYLLGGTAAVSELVEMQVVDLLAAKEPGSATSASSGVGGNASAPMSTADAGLALAGLTLLPLAAWFGRRRHRRGPTGIV